VLLKREDMQPVFSFKLRGAYNKMAHLTPAQLKRGVSSAPRPATTRRAWRWRRSGSAAGGDRDAGHHAADQDRRRRGARREGGAGTAIPTTRPTATRWNWRRSAG
jgi:hypothetical protein